MKRILAGQFMKEYALVAENLYMMIMKDLGNLKMCYVEDVLGKHSDHELAWMFLVDGCATLQFMHCFENYEKFRRMNITDELVVFATQDILLLENQLPYALLELLISSVVQKTEQEIIRYSIDKFISGCNIFLTERLSAKKLREVPTCHLLGLLRQATGVDFKAENKARPFITGDSPTFHSATQLTVSGIRFKPFYEASLEISFKRGFWGILRLPPVIVDESLFLPMFLSLASYEKCPDFLNGKEVTSYIWFLDSLIQHPDDVKVLREAGILINFFGSEEEIAELFKMVAKDLVPNPDLYSNLRFEIEVHYKKKWRPRIYQLIKVSQDYWTMLKVGAFITIFFTVVQTYFALPLHKSKT
ncbi:hypothetical protein P3X46_017354 [Hevea brasiliensis]|uniref:Uncharacterized protein n=1 Tax=Hevea brasiliensis TaxID=3981 RepID=A0ABQ9M245_HEVBR|nr:uncharacterized protein LOC110673047 [Hevea brasiliensis]KAJ9174317.1 hypothetical protein P3X46_017354 [Hevea brasiliensis]